MLCLRIPSTGATATLAALLLLAACSDSPAKLGANSDAIAPALLEGATFEVGSLEPREDRTRYPRGVWQFEAPEGTDLVGVQGHPAVRLQGVGKRSVSVQLGGAAPPVRLELSLSSRQSHDVTVVAQLIAGERVVPSEPVTVRVGREPTPVVVPVPRTEGAVAAVLEFETEAQDLDVVDVAEVVVIESQDLRQGLPPVGPGTEKRPGVGLRPGHRIAREIELPGESTLSFSVRGRDRTGRVRVLADGEPLTTVTAEADEWNSVRVPLEQRGRVKLAFEALESNDEACWVTEARVDRLGVDAPTVFLITSDTHRGDHMGRFGAGDLVRTPVLDAVSDRGVFFTNCFAATNVTNPSHIALMTGMHLRDTRIVDNSTAVIDSARTIAEAFSEGGYRTFGVTSVLHLTGRQSGLDQGFDRFDAPETGKRDGRVAIEQLYEWIREADGQPVFAWLHVYDAHSPYEPPQEFIDRYYPSSEDPTAEEHDLGLNERHTPTWIKNLGLRDPAAVHARYRGAVDYVDTSLADLFALDRMNRAIVAFTSDHGESFGTDGVHWDHRRLNVDTMHVPLVLAWPGATSATCDVPVRQIDIGATITALAGLDAAFPGRDLRLALEEDPVIEPRYGISSNGYSAAIESEGWLLSLQLKRYGNSMVTKTWDYGVVELYNLHVDPGATENVLDQEFERGKALRRALIRWLSDADPAGLGSANELSEEARQSLVALGYSGDQTNATEDWWVERPGDPWVDRFSE